MCVAGDPAVRRRQGRAARAGEVETEVERMKKKVTWILVADGARARILMNEGPGKGLRPAVDGEFTHELPPTRDLGSDRPGRLQARGQSARDAITPHVDWHQFEKTKFGKEMAKLLDDAVDRNAFDRLVLVAPPRMLGDLRAALAPKTRALVQGELDKDLTHVPLHELPSHLANVIPL
jgi:protein required for attachment to host cells